MKPVKRPRKLRRRGSLLTPILALVVFTALASVVTFTRPAKVESVVEKQVALVNEQDRLLVPVPIRPIARGEKLKEVPFTRVKWAKDQLVGDYLLEIPSSGDAVASSALPKLLPVPLSAVINESLDGNMVVEGIPEGMRAITVKVDAESAVEGWARSGNYVDVILIRASKENEKGLEAKVIAENVKILSAGRSTKPLQGTGTAPEAPTTVTLLVNQEDSLKVKAAASLGKLTFALRGQGDEQPSSTIAMNQKKLLGESKTAKAQEEDYKGFARGPDGKLFLLNGKSKWIRTTELPATMRVEEPTAASSLGRAQLAEPTPDNKTPQTGSK